MQGIRSILEQEMNNPFINTHDSLQKYWVNTSNIVNGYIMRFGFERSLLGGTTTNERGETRPTTIDTSDMYKSMKISFRAICDANNMARKVINDERMKMGISDKNEHLKVKNY